MQQISATSSERLASETAEEREVRLQRLIDRLASETARLQQTSGNRHERLATETAKENDGQAATDEC